jgi:tetratricopeptide (TPR) repeat protein
MGFINNLFSKRKIPGGYIAYFQLESFWEERFSKEEREYITDTFIPMEIGSTNPPKRILTEGSISYSSESAATFLSNLAGWFDNPKDRDISKKLVEKSLSLLEDSNNLVDLHYALSSAITIYYKERTDESIMKKVIDLCYKQIQIAKKAIPALRKELYLTKEEHLPTHKGYEQLAIILKKQKNFKEVIQICEKAKKEGWSGDWDKRITYANKKLSF